jgi:hypothetical protein
MAKQPLRLVPLTGRKLADVARNVELQAVLCSTLLTTVVKDKPEIKNKMLFELRATLASSNLSPHHREIYGDALQIISHLIVK